MAFINMVDWSPVGDQNVFAWKYPHTNLSTYTQLVVNESQEAVLFSKGRIVGKFGPGKHTLDTENLPLLRSLFGIPFGGKNPFTAEVWFVNKLQPCNIEWNISSMSIHDVDYNTQLPLTASGQYGLRVADAEKFLAKIVGTRTVFTERDMTDQFRGEVQTKVKSCILQYMISQKVGYKQISAYLDMLSGYLKEQMTPFWNELGVTLTKFYVSSIDIDSTTEEGQRIREAISQQSSMSITGHTWQQEQMFDTAGNAINSMGNGNGGLLGGLMAIGMMGGLGGGGGVGAGMMQPQYNQPSFNNGGGAQGQMQGQPGQMGGQQGVKMVYCSNCAKKYPSTSKFCPYCGDPYNPCPKCGTDNDLNAKRCVSCGAPLTQGPTNCPNCNAPLAPGSKFCTNCGMQLVSSDTCSRCGAHLDPSAKFCPVCGNKR